MPAFPPHRCRLYSSYPTSFRDSWGRFLRCSQALLLRKPMWPLLRSADTLLDRTWALLDFRSWATERQCTCCGSASRVLLRTATLCLLELPAVGTRGTNWKGHLLCYLLLLSHVSCPSRFICTLKSQATSWLKTVPIGTNPVVWLPGTVHGLWRYGQATIAFSDSLSP